MCVCEYVLFAACAAVHVQTDTPTHNTETHTRAHSHNCLPSRSSQLCVHSHLHPGIKALQACVFRVFSVYVLESEATSDVFLLV